MPSIEKLRERAKDHAKQLQAVFYAKTSDLQARWNCDVGGILEIPRDDLPYIEVGDSDARRYDPRDVEQFEEKAKRGEVKIPAKAKDTAA